MDQKLFEEGAMYYSFVEVCEEISNEQTSVTFDCIEKTYFDNNMEQYAESLLEDENAPLSKITTTVEKSLNLQEGVWVGIEIMNNESNNLLRSIYDASIILSNSQEKQFNQKQKQIKIAFLKIDPNTKKVLKICHKF
ncbi:hypothetical protein M0813_06640 [Anaeramoeba flamelloides]|uniref:Uncharacterized protein n=1 Tax=Anaeramoeba flamelloides TaxID=1746091 RepID=A0AAV8A9L5_9EUKA|nr:hypothetical protein M0812_05323 [Anaeramoeba flamelloides]KAJ6230648.1 hypothetical protein M0813_06640 [Anaeramoeba flamelloides]